MGHLRATINPSCFKGLCLQREPLWPGPRALPGSEMTGSSLIKPDRARRLGGAGQLLHSGFLTPECFTLHLHYCLGYNASASAAALVLLPPPILSSLHKFPLSLSLKKGAQESPQATELYTARCLKCMFKTMTSLCPSAKQ